MPAAKRPPLFLLLLLSLLAACQPANKPSPISTLLPETLITFRATLPAPLNPGEALLLTVLDEVSGLAFNPQRYPLTADDDRHYSITLRMALGSTVKYRYQRQGNFTLQEHLPDGRPVHYRLYVIDGPGAVEDIISRWTDTGFTGETGRMPGVVSDAQSGQALPGVLLTAGGAQTFSASDGSFLLEGLAPGLHNLAAYDPSGLHLPYQQGALVAGGAATPAQLTLAPAKLVNVAFVVKIPENTPPEAAIRLAGNLLALGNTFADLTGGMNSAASRMPTLSRLPDGRFNLTLALPAGADIRYKYTLGDGLWSAELGKDGNLRTRQIIVPENGGMIEDSVLSWSSPERGVVNFDVYAPSTPMEEGVSIQFHPGFSWTEPIPMWAMGNGRWRFTLSSPLYMLDEIGYRYCRADQCGQADDIQTQGSDSPPRGKIAITAEEQWVQDVIAGWAWQTSPQPAVAPNLKVNPRQADFAAGVEFVRYYDATWQPRWPQALQAVKQLNANWVILTPGWSFTRINPPALEYTAGQDLPWGEALQLGEQASLEGLQTAIYPGARFGTESGQWWQTAQRDFAWWISWFDRYQTFALHYADLARRSGSKVLILGGTWLAPALPGGTLADGSPSGVPADAEARWRSLIAAARERFPEGKIFWALSYPQEVKTPPPFADAVDGLYILWSVPLPVSAEALEMKTKAGQLLDEDLATMQQTLNKPLWLGLSYPSAKGGAAGCVQTASGDCLSSEYLALLREDVPEIAVDFEEQTRAYRAVFAAVEERPWIGGVISQGFLPSLALQDKSDSVRGKSAGGILWFWFPLWLGK